MSFIDNYIKTSHIYIYIFILKKLKFFLFVI